MPTNTFSSLLQDTSQSHSEMAGSKLKTIYPQDLFSVTRYFTQIEILKHAVGDSRNGLGGVENREYNALIYLPLPLNFSEGEYRQRYDDTKSLLSDVSNALKGTTGAAESYALSGPYSSTNPNPKTIQSISTTFSILRSAAGLITGGARAVGTFADFTYNPFAYISYQRPEFRTYKLEWVLAPRNEYESKLIQNVTNWLKFYSHPKLSGADRENPSRTSPSGSFFEAFTMQYPHEMRLRFVHNTGDLNGPSYSEMEDLILPRPKTAFLKSIEVAYFQTDGSYSFFKGTKNPVVTTISCIFQENEILAKDDFDNVQIYEERNIQNVTTLEPFVRELADE